MHLLCEARRLPLNKGACKCVEIYFFGNEHLNFLKLISDGQAFRIDHHKMPVFAMHIHITHVRIYVCIHTYVPIF